MRDYFKRLQFHPGLGIASMMSMLGFLAGAGNTSFQVWWQGGLFGLITVGGLCWSIVLWSNRR